MFAFIVTICEYVIVENDATQHKTKAMNMTTQNENITFTKNNVTYDVNALFETLKSQNVR